MLTLHDYLPSGNCYKVRLLLTQLGIPFRRSEVKLRMSLETAREFRKINPLGRVPALGLDDGTVLAESNAILWHFAEGTPFLPAPCSGCSGSSTTTSRSSPWCAPG